MADQPIRWDAEDIAQLAEVTPADQKAADAYVQAVGSPLLRALYGAAPYVPPGERGE